jgi:hypothetical protein
MNLRYLCPSIDSPSRTNRAMDSNNSNLFSIPNESQPQNILLIFGQFVFHLGVKGARKNAAKDTYNLLR